MGETPDDDFSSNCDFYNTESESNIIRCNERIIHDTPLMKNSMPSLNDEIRKTIEVGSILGYNMNGQEKEVESVIQGVTMVKS